MLHLVGVISIGIEDHLSWLNAIRNFFLSSQLDIVIKVAARSLVCAVISTGIAGITFYCMLRRRVPRRSIGVAVVIASSLLANPICKAEGWNQMLIFLHNFISTPIYGEFAVRVALISNLVPFGIALLFYGQSQSSIRNFHQYLKDDRAFVGRFLLIFIPMVFPSMMFSLATNAAIAFGASIEPSALGVSNISIDRMITDLAGGQQFELVSAFACVVSAALLVVALAISASWKSRSRTGTATSFRLRVIRCFSSLNNGFEIIFQKLRIKTESRNQFASIASISVISAVTLYVLSPTFFLLARALNVIDAGTTSIGNFSIFGFLSVVSEPRLLSGLSDTVCYSLLGGAFATVLAFSLGSLAWSSSKMRVAVIACVVISILPSAASIRGWQAAKILLQSVESSCFFFLLSQISYALPYSVACLWLANREIDVNKFSILKELGASPSYVALVFLPRITWRALLGTFCVGFLLISTEASRAQSLNPSPTKSVGLVIAGLIKSGGDGAERAYATGTLLWLFTITIVVAAGTVVRKRGS